MFALATHVPTREAVQLGVNERHQLIESRFVATAPGKQQLGHRRRRWEMTASM